MAEELASSAMFKDYPLLLEALLEEHGLWPMTAANLNELKLAVELARRVAARQAQARQEWEQAKREAAKLREGRG